MFAIQRPAGHRRSDALQRIERGHRPVRAKRESGAGVEQRAEGVSALDTFFPDALLRPTAIISGVIRLHRCNNPGTPEADHVLRAQMLRMLDAEAAVARAIC